MRIIPAIDIIDGKCVRLLKGDYSTKIEYGAFPLETAKSFEAHGIEYLHLVDLDGAKAKKIVNHKVLESITNNTNLKVDFGGGVKNEEDLHIAFESGANQVTGGSIAIKDPALFKQWIIQYGADKIILGADVKDEKIAVSGWLETTTMDLMSFLADYINDGAQYAICTDINKDGTLEGPSFDLYEKILNKHALNLIASGGISDYDELGRLAKIGCDGTIIGKALYENRITLKQLEQYILNN
jgi:phosphoribosylformimino-5-aminoimidazole carboxamide ribotide isomerase